MELEKVGIDSKIFMRNSDVVSRKIAGEFFLVPVKGKIADIESVFTLTAVAEYIWERLDGRKNLGEILKDVVDHFDVQREEAEPDVREFIIELMEAGLINEERI